MQSQFHAKTRIIDRSQHHTAPRRHGFTLLEMMIVLAIISIIALFAIPDTTNPTARKDITAALTHATAIKAAIAEYYYNQGSFPKNNDDLGLPAPNQLISNYVAGIEVDNGAIHILMGQQSVGPTQGKTISIRPILVQEATLMTPLSWICGLSDVPQGMQAVGENKTNTPAAMLPLDCRRKNVKKPTNHNGQDSIKST